MTIGCSASLNCKETVSQQEMENDSFRCEKMTDAELGGRGDPEGQRVYEECMVTGGQKRCSVRCNTIYRGLVWNLVSTSLILSRVSL